MSMNRFQYVELPDRTLKITGYLSSPGYEEIEIPAELDGKKVSTIGKRAFANRGGALYQIVVEDGITTIEDEAFGDPYLSDIYLPNSISSVTGNPFHIPTADMIKEHNVHFSANHQYLIINDGILFGKTDKRIICYFSNSRSVYIVPSGIKTIGKHAIVNNILTKVFLPDSVDRIEENGIEGQRLSSIRLPSGLKHIGKRAFPANAVSNSYIVPRTVEVIEGAAFTNMHIELESNEMNFYIKNKVLIEKSTETVLCFTEPNVTSLIVPGSVKTIAKGAFSNSQITSVTIPDSVQNIEDEAFWGTRHLEKIELPKHIHRIGESAFEGCTKLRIKVPSSVTEIGDYAFGGRTRYDLVNLLIVEPDSFAEEYAKKRNLQYSTETSDLDPMGWLNGNEENNEYDEYEDDEYENYFEEHIHEGDLVEFGSYYFSSKNQELYTMDWNVIKKDEKTLWLLSRNMIEVKPFNTFDKPRNDIPQIMDSNGDYAYIWHNSSIREWLNDEFYEMAFDDDEKDVLVKQVLTFPSYREEYFDDEFKIHGYTNSDSFSDTEDYVTLPPWENEDPEDDMYLNDNVGLPTPYAYEKMIKRHKNRAVYYQLYYWRRNPLMHTAFNKAYLGSSEHSADEVGFIRPVIRIDQNKFYNLLNSYNTEYLDGYKERLFKEREANKEKKEKIEAERKQRRLNNQ